MNLIPIFTFIFFSLGVFSAIANSDVDKFADRFLNKNISEIECPDFLHKCEVWEVKKNNIKVVVTSGVLVNDTILKDLEADVALYPGMLAEVFLIAGERTVADNLRQRRNTQSFW